jgi:predicted dehydrogenase
MMEAMWTRFLPHVVALRDLIARGVLGELVMVEADHGQWFAPDPNFRLFARELGGSAVLDLGVYPVSFASMLLGPPSRMVTMVDPAFSGVDGQASMIFGYDSGAQALLTCTSAARSATRACVTGTLARVEIDADFYAPTTFRLITRAGEVTNYDFEVAPRGLRFEAIEVARCLEAGLAESSVMPLDETVTIMETLEKVMATLEPAPTF